MSKANKKEKAPKEKRDFSDIFWIGRLMVVVSSVYSGYVILSGLYGEVIPAVMVAPMLVYAALLLYRGR